MKNIPLNYHKNILLLIIMIVIPLAGASLLLIVLLYLPKESSGLFNISAIVLSIILMASTLYFAINKHIIIPCEVNISEYGFNFKLIKKSIFYRKYDFFSGWENIIGISEVFCSATGKYFYRIKFTNPRITADFSPQRNKETEAEILFSELDYYQETFMINESKKNKKSVKTWSHS